MQLKALINNRARAIKVSSQLVMQGYVLERLLERIATSRFSDSFIVKGGFLLASIIGLDTRTTKDLDATVRNLNVTEEELRFVFTEITKLNSDDDLSFEVGGIEEIHEGNDYPGLRVHITAHYEQLSIPLGVDVTTGDSIIPPAVRREFPRMFGEGSFSALSYPLETVAAEKIETVLSRSTANTRARDFYDIYSLSHLLGESIRSNLLRDALLATTAKRNSVYVLSNVSSTVAFIAADTSLHRLWEAYINKNNYAKEISFVDTCDAVIDLLARAGFIN